MKFKTKYYVVYGIILFISGTAFIAGLLQSFNPRNIQIIQNSSIISLLFVIILLDLLTRSNKFSINLIYEDFLIK
jgi:hypothetical protein